MRDTATVAPHYLASCRRGWRWSEQAWVAGRRVSRFLTGDGGRWPTPAWRACCSRCAARHRSAPQASAWSGAWPSSCRWSTGHCRPPDRRSRGSRSACSKRCTSPASARCGPTRAGPSGSPVARWPRRSPQPCCGSPSSRSAAPGPSGASRGASWRSPRPRRPCCVSRPTEGRSWSPRSSP